MVLLAAAMLLSMKILHTKAVDSREEKETQFSEDLLLAVAEHQSLHHQSC